MLTQYIIREAVLAVAPQYEIDEVYLFGSYARGDATEDSDCDLRIVGGDMRSLFDLGGLHEDLADTLGTQIDLVLTKNISKEFYSLIKDEEVMVYAKI